MRSENLGGDWRAPARQALKAYMPALRWAQAQLVGSDPCADALRRIVVAVIRLRTPTAKSLFCRVLRVGRLVHGIAIV
jgi:hypothetical protein